MAGPNAVDDCCWDENCPYQNPHKHVATNDGCYIKYIVEKKKDPIELKSYGG